MDLEYVDQYYDMDPFTEKLLPDGGFLENGMVVLAESPSIKGDLTFLNAYANVPHLRTTWEQQREYCNLYNRWCQISALRSRRMLNDKTEPLIEFVATYANGTQRKHVHSRHAAWFVKIDSIPIPSELTFSEKLHKVGQAVRDLDSTLNLVLRDDVWVAEIPVPPEYRDQ